MNSLTVLCFLGLHEVARELENPFINVPNDLPLCTFQAQYNEALGTMFSSYHPDSWFTIEEVDVPGS
jgi:predicted membrane chloride channel (bestrophin family)